MKRSSAPSQLSRKDSRASFFSPPYKLPQKKSAENHQTYPNNANINHTTNGKRDLSLPSGKSTSDLLNIIENDPPKSISAPTSGISCQTSTKNHLLENRKDDNASISPKRDLDTKYFSVVWCKLSNKKHKKWEGDAVLIVKSRSVILKDMEGKDIGRGSGYKLKDLESLEDGNTLPVGAKEIEIQHEILSEDYISGKCFLSLNNCELSGLEVKTANELQKPKVKPFRLPFRDHSNNQGTKKGLLTPLHDVTNINSIVLPKPPAQHQWKYNSSFSTTVDVVVDPIIGKHLRPHQQAGVIFLYECVMGFRLNEYRGAILADEMGLGKTLQCITLVWTLLKQGPYGGSPVLKRVLIVTPSSLVINWSKEFDKWLGNTRVKTFTADQTKKVNEFMNQTICPILIVSYETLVRSTDLVQKMNFDLLLCDEGHRLKNGQIKTSTLINSLNIRKRVILSGTPIQNDLKELFALIEFVNPGILGTPSMYRKVYEEPILLSQQPSASAEEKEIGESRSAELNRLCSKFILRRTQEIINKLEPSVFSYRILSYVVNLIKILHRYLPPKTEFVIFCQPSQTQTDIYESIVGCKSIQRCILRGEFGDHLAAICILRKLCNHPALLSRHEDEFQSSDLQLEAASLLPTSVTNSGLYMEEDSGKLAVLSCLLWSIAETKREKIVLVSNFTSTLDMLQQMCERYQYSFLRLDGSTPSSKRQSLVDRFNNTSGREFVFLLSGKAGGVGLNLIGASRIVLFDIDWNPATDLQAMARVWRDGQKKHVYIYRFLLAGSLEEKIYQRQIYKQGISGSVVDARHNSKSHFSQEELKDLFTFYPDVSCLTHDLLDCQCDKKGSEISPSQSSLEEFRDCQLGVPSKTDKTKKATMDQLHRWQHFSFPESKNLMDDEHIENGVDFILFAFKNKSTETDQMFNV